MIEVKNLVKRYGSHTAVSDLSFTIEKGQIYGFLGPNGAGKSTTMNIMTGCLAATSGEVKIGGYDIFEQGDKAKRLIGYLPEQPPLYLDRTPREYLTFVARAKRVPKKDIDLEVIRARDMTRITDVADRIIKTLSKGYKQRVGIAQAVLGNPEIIILDEPTVGLDPNQIIEIRSLIQELGKDHTVILSSHILSEVQAVCQTILIISKGKLVACDTPENLEKQFTGTDTIHLIAEAGEDRLREILSAVEGVELVEITEAEENRCTAANTTVEEVDDAICREIFFSFAKANCAILRMAADRASLEDIFIELTRSSGEDEAYDEASGNDAEYEYEDKTEDDEDSDAEEGGDAE